MRCGGGAVVAALLALCAAELQFDHQLYNLTIPENCGPRTRAAPPPGAPPPALRLPAPAATLRFRIRHGDKDKLFKAEERTVGDRCFLTVRTRANHAGAINRERRDQYRLVVRATATLPGDGGVLEADTTLVVRVSDENDLTPLFYPTEYEATLREDTPPHTSVLRVHADDADLGLNGEIYYSLLHPNDHFDVHPTSGVLSLTRPPVAAERAQHELVVLARDRASLLERGPLAPADRARVLVHVTPANMHAPELRVRKLPELVENSTAEIYAIVEVTDRDEGEAGRISSVEIVDGDPDGHFRVRASAARQPHEWDVVAHALLDREAAPGGYNLTLRARDAGRPPRAAYLQLAVMLTDANDNAPVFSRRVYEARVSETAPPGTPLLRLKVSDRDQGRNARVYLEMVGGNEGGEFAVNADSGVLYTAAALDADTRQLYTLTVAAVDQGAAGARHQSSAKVKVQVMDANDNDPLFTPDTPRQVAVAENAPPGGVVARVHARDKDSGENAYISYSLANVQPVPFEVDHFSGAVRATRLLDYESMRREYTLVVRASDWGLPYRRQAEHRLRVTLTDVNDNRPQFERVECVGYVPRRTPPGTPLHTLSALDLDAGDVVSYRIASGNDDNCFALDAASGVLTLACDLNGARGDTRQLNVTATDGTHFADPTPLTLHVVSGGTGPAPLECRDTGAARRLAALLAAAAAANAPPDAADEFPSAPARYGDNLHAPELVEFPVEVRVNESAPLGSELVVLRARDRDLGYNGLLVFAISAGDPDSAFRVEPESGALQLIGYLDREREHEYYLNVTVYDLGRPPRATSRLLPVTVLDANDNAPRFERSLASIRVTESALNGTQVFRANATDPDAGLFARVHYSLSGADGEFCVGRGSGVVTVCAPLDRERRAQYELSVRATDGGGRWAEARVRVTVDDVNDNAPRFMQAAYSARVREDVPPGALVAVLAAADPDEGAAGTLHYELRDHEDGVLTVDAVSGAVRTTQWLDYERRQVYGAVVRCTDGGQPPLWSEVTLVLEVLDVDENRHAPQFSEPVALAVTVLEDAAVGTRVAALAAHDADAEGRDSRLSYYIVDGSGMAHFTIDDAGVLRTATPLDRETAPHYWLTVAAEDHGLVPKYTTTQVYVEVLDVNEFAPWPLVAQYSALLPELAAAGTRVVRVQAHDYDAADTNVTYSIVAGNPDGLFSIDQSTGWVVTTGRSLDRESAALHALEVRCSDGQLAASARVAVQLLDVNEHAPQFTQRLYDIRVPVPAPRTLDADTPNTLQQADAAADSESSTEWDTETEEEAEEEEGQRAHWDSLVDTTGMRYIATVVAVDSDYGPNGTVRYSARARGPARGQLRVHASTGRLYAPPHLALHTQRAIDITVRACDGGAPPLCAVARATVRGVASGGGRAPLVTPLPALQVAELDAPGFLLALLPATDPDKEQLYYDIVAGDEQQQFAIGRDDGSLVLVKRLVWEQRPQYALNVSVTDGLHVVYTIVTVTVINDVHEAGVWFTEPQYYAAAEEGAPAGLALLSVRAEGAPRLRYGVQDGRAPSSLQLFTLHETTGLLQLRHTINSSHCGNHSLTVWARDSAPRSSRAVARVQVVVRAREDAPPTWGRRLVEPRLPAGAPAGTLVTALRAAHPTATNITYSLQGGDANGLFYIDAPVSEVRLSRALPASAPLEYTLLARAAPPPPAPPATLTVHLLVSQPDSAPPVFTQPLVVCSIRENAPPGTAVGAVEARGGGGAVRYSLRGGGGRVAVAPLAGTLTTTMVLDYEEQSVYNLTVTALAMGGGEAEATVTVHVLDRNEFPPRLTQRHYRGEVAEDAPVGSLVALDGQPLLLTTTDQDGPANRQRRYEIVEPDANRRFQVDDVTGALRIIDNLDYEEAKEHNFTVKVHDMGSPRLLADSSATVSVSVVDVNDVPPAVGAPQDVTLLLPTARGVIVTNVPANDPDLPPGGRLHYYLEGDPSGAFTITPNGTILVEQPDTLLGQYSLTVTCSDGELRASVRVRVRCVRAAPAGLAFASADHLASVAENSTKIVTLLVLNVLGAALNEHVQFSVLNHHQEFQIGPTSGALRTTGVPLDRERCDSYTLLIEARSTHASSTGVESEPRVAHCRVHVTVTDINDNCPVFVGRPYVAGALAGARAGTQLIAVHALDHDAGDNGEVRYEMKRGHGELFRVDRRTGQLSLRQELDALPRTYSLLLAAYDGGVPACGVDTEVIVRVWSGGAAPAWPQAHYTLTAPEDTPVGAALTPALQAISPLQRQLIYSLVWTDHTTRGLFDVHFETGVVTVVSAVDYERCAVHSLAVRATDSVTGVSADVNVTVRLTDVNDCAPALGHDVYRGTVSEAARRGQLIITVSATDNDTGVAGSISYSLSAAEGEQHSNSSLALFSVASDGAVRVNGALDAETQRLHHLLVTATDGGQPPLATTAHLFITVEDVNDNPPVLERSVLSAAVALEATRDVAVTRVAAWDPDLLDTRLTFALDADDTAFAVDAHSGLVTLQRPLLWPGDALALNVSVSDGAHAVLARVKVTPAPVNRHAPRFLHLVQEARALENRTPPLLLTTVKAYDSDLGVYGSVTYSIPDARLRDTFAIDAQSGALTTRVPLDREDRAHWEVVVAATDGGGLRRHTVVRVLVSDDNDSPPVFPLLEYRATVRCDRAIKLPFITLQAKDDDASEHARLTYTVYEGDVRSDATGLFHIDAHTGDLSFARNATQFGGRVVQVWVRARDGGGLAAEAPVAVFVLAAGQSAPAVLPPPADLFVPEDAPPGTLIAELRSEAPPPRYRLAPALWARDLFSIDAAGRLTVSGPLDRESAAEHVIGIIAEGAGSPAAGVLLTTRLHVLDVNEHAPEFHSQPYVLHVAENTPVDTTLTQLVADDPDSGSNGEVHYSLLDDSGLFAVDAASGWVVTRGQLDREARAEHRLALLASDGGTPAKTTKGTLIIRLIDYNDCPHTFQQHVYTAEVPEDAMAGTVVTRLELQDPDSVSSPVTFLLVSGDPRARFQLRASGELLVARQLDRETQAVYELKVVATDGKFDAYTTVNVTVTDVNDNPPYCLRPRYWATVSEAAAAGTRLVQLMTGDLDEGPHHHRHTLEGDHHHHFHIDEGTGVVTVAGPLDRESRAAYTLVAHARDRQRDQWGCSSEIRVTISDENDNVPVFSVEGGHYDVTLPEDADVGTLVAKVHAVDADEGDNRLVRYHWADEDGGGELFALATDSGIITLRAPLDRETQPEHRLAVTARDHGTPALTATATVRLSVSDVNDNPPEFEFREYHATLSELAEAGARVLRVRATSRDSGVNAEVRYSLVGGDGRDDFDIHPNTGELSVVRPLDYERRARYLLSVQAVDGGQPPLSDLATINVTISDANDNAPMFPQSKYTARVREDAAVGTRVLQLIAQDADAGLNGRLTYSLGRGDPAGQFTVEPDTGYLVVAAPLDRETQAEYALEVRARDHGLPALEAAAAVALRVLDVNDNAPRFERDNYTAVVREDQPLGQPLLALLVTDADEPPNGAPYTYDLQAGNEAGAFRLEPDGTLRTAARFSRRVRERYVLRVRVFDNGAPPLYADTWVSVRVLQRPQYPPVVTPLEVSVISYLDAFPGGVLGKVFASDRDLDDVLSYALVPTAGSELFTLDAMDGTLRAAPRLDAGEYRLNVSVSDGRYSGHAAVRVSVLLVTDELLAQAAVVRFRAVSDADFVLSHRKGFVRAVAEAVERAPSDVVLVSVQPSDLQLPTDDSSRRKRQVAQDLDVSFAVRADSEHVGGWLSLEALRRRLHARVERLEERARLVLEELVRVSCDGGCGAGECRERVQLMGAPRVVASDVYALVAPAHRAAAACVCAPPYSGPRCDQRLDDSDSSGEVTLAGDGYLVYRVERGVVAGARLLDDELDVSLRFRTRRPRGTLVSARGRVDYALLELLDGQLQWSMELGSGVVTVRVGEHLHDGAWHEARVQRRGGAVRLLVDRRSAASSAPPPNAVLDVRADRLLLGAQLVRHVDALAPEQITYGFEGCISDLKLGNSALPLEEGGTSSDGRVQLVRAVRAPVGATCGPLRAHGACGGYPCENGGTCQEAELGALLEEGADGGYTCTCHARYTGARCEHDTLPCAGQPCLHGGECEPARGSDPPYRCECGAGLAGARCERGHWCAPGACQHGGHCEEGEWGPSCVCRGYWGARCQHDVDECAGEPCLNGATCVNEPGSFRCVCPPGTTGSHCGNPLHSHAVTAGAAGPGLGDAWRWAVNERWPLAAAAAAALALLLAIVLPLALRARRRPPPPPPPLPHKTAPLNSARSKLSNLEAERRERPLSAAAAAAEPAPLNNMDTLRSYGSAGDELEALPPHYIRNLNLDAPDRKPWSEQMHLQTFVDNKIYNDLKGSKSPVVSRRGRQPLAVAEPRLLGGYHWDCSDWCAPAAALPNISEVAGSERRDSSSPPPAHHQPRLPPPPAFCSPQLPLESDSADHDTEPSRLTDASSLLLHAPRALSDSECGLRAPAHRIREPDSASLITMLEERNSLLGGDCGGRDHDRDGGSCSDVSARLCEIEDSDGDEGGEGPGGGGGGGRHTAV